MIPEARRRWTYSCCAGTPTAVFQNLSTPQWTLPTYGLYYQWGRKDPSPRPPSYDFDMQSMETIPFFGPNGEPVNYISEFSSDENTKEDSARNPLLLMDQNIQGRTMPTTGSITKSTSYGAASQ